MAVWRARYPVTPRRIRENPEFIGSQYQGNVGPVEIDSGPPPTATQYVDRPTRKPFIDEVTGMPIPAAFVGVQDGLQKDTRPEMGSWEDTPDRQVIFYNTDYAVMETPYGEGEENGSTG